MNEDLRTKLAQDLEHAGFSAEMKTLQAFLRCGWHAEGSAVFLDRDENKMREIDVRAYQELDDDEFPINCALDIHVEVKKASAPWIIFRARTPMIPRYEPLFWGDVDAPPEFDPPWYEVCTGSIIADQDWTAYGIHEAFKKPDQPSRAYAALLSAAKAADHDVADLKHWESENPREIRTTSWSPGGKLVVAQPLVVVDGVLTVAELGDNGQVLIEELDMATFRLSYMSPAYARGRYSVDIVTLSALDRYIEKTTVYHKDVMARYRSMAISAARPKQRPKVKKRRKQAAES